MSKVRFADLFSLCLLTALSMHGAWAQTASPAAPAAPPAAAAPVPPPLPSAAMETRCAARNFADAYYIRDGQKRFDDERYHAFALRLNTPVYKDSTGDALAGKVLHFSERVAIADPAEGSDRIGVKDTTSESIGWVSRDAVLCAEYPTTDIGGTGLYKRVVVRTDTAVQGQVVPKNLYQTPDAGTAQRCEGSCAQVSRFQWYFIYGEDSDHYLISEAANLISSSARLMGWLPKGDGYVWNTALGLRPKESLANVPPGAPEKFACAYKTLEQLIAAREADCNQILGGPRWFGLNVRMAVVKETPQAYEVLFSNAQTAGQDNISTAAQGLNNLDVFFVLDGTKSMQPAIDAIKRLTAQINAKMKTKTSQGNGVVRYGFRVYRDSSAKTKKDGVADSEALPLDKSQCNKSNQTEFEAKLAPVKAYDPDDDDDFSENSFGGMVQAAEDVSGCPNNSKLVFVIGDAGYDADKQRSRGFTPWTEDAIAKRFRNKRLSPTSNFETLPLLFFVQTPKEGGRLSNQTGYDKAYSAFKTQGQSILSQIYAGTKITDTRNLFIDLQGSAGAGEQAAIDAALRQVDNSMNPGAIAAILEGLNRGESLEQVIERLRNNSHENIPIKFLEIAEESLCRRLGEQCRTQVLEAVNQAFVPVDNKVEPEVLLSRDQLDKWLKLLGVFRDFGRDAAGNQGRQTLVNTMLQAIGTLVHVDMQNDGVSMANKLQFASGLPNSGRSKIMQYSDADLINANLVPACEIDNLKTYSIKKYDVLNVVFGSNGDLRPAFTETTWPEGACPLSPKGKAIPFLDGDVRGQQLNPPGRQNYSLRHQRGGESFFWLPVNYLP